MKRATKFITVLRPKSWTLNWNEFSFQFSFIKQLLIYS